jgi:hypothetical protein
MSTIRRERLYSNLSSFTELEFAELVGRIQTADIIRHHLKNLKITNEELASRWNWDEEFVHNLLFASYDYDLKTIAELETFFTEKAGKEVKIWIIK